MSSFLSGLARAYLRFDASFARARQITLSAAAGFFSNALTIEEQSRLSVRIYETASRRQTRRDIADWEVKWFARRLPLPPARVLVGAAGLGPEVLHLVERGYRVDALEPSRTSAAACKALGVGTMLAATYEDLAAAVLDGSQPGSDIATQRYDAVVLGWGSLSHVLSSFQRARLLEVCDKLAPRGPILASFLEGTNGKSSAHRARSVGGKLGRLVRRARRHVSKDSEDTNSIGFGSWFGFIHIFTVEEVEELAAGIARRVIWEADERCGYPHVTLLSSTQIVPQ